MRKINIKTIYLVGVITIGLIGLAVGSTYAMFTTSIEINNPISISTTLSSESDIIDTFDIEVGSGETKEITINIINSSGNNLNYACFYITDSSDIESGISHNNSDSNVPVGTISSNTTKKVYAQLKNNSSSPITITVGVISSVEGIVKNDNMILFEDVNIASSNLATYITNLYNNSSKTTTTANGITYNLATSVGLMNDRLGSSNTSIDGGNIRYYGSDVNNYIYFNCSNYSNQNADTCEVWRIIGVFDGKVKIIRSAPIESLALDYDANNDTGGTSYSSKWEESSIKNLLNEKYYNGSTTVTYYSSYGPSYTSKTLDMTSISIKNDTTRSMISNSVWRIGGKSTYDTLYIDEVYSTEGNTSFRSDYAVTWTGKIAIPNLSDYGYAVDLSKCVKDTSSWSSCTSDNWMHSVITGYTWTLLPFSLTEGHYITESAGVDKAASGTSYYIYPVLSLDTSIVVSGNSNGEYYNPFKIVPEGTTINPDNNNTLAKRIINLYNNAEKTTTVNNGITYNQATSVGLMNDRKGKASTPLNAGNIRYYGANPNNYIYFNCSNYSNQSSTTCEVWRIIGVFDGKVKIIRSAPIESLALDYDANNDTGGTSYSSKWEESSIKTLLNEKYYNGSTTVTYYSSYGPSYTSKTLDMSTIGIKNDTTRNMIANTVWRIGGKSTSNLLYADGVYSTEANATFESSYLTSWIGKIAIPNLSDYGYATDLSKCTVNTSSWGSNTGCTSNNWIHSILTGNTWTMLPYTTSQGHYITESGGVSTATSGTSYNIYPMLSLDIDIDIDTTSSGNSTNPYKIVE